MLGMKELSGEKIVEINWNDGDDYLLTTEWEYLSIYLFWDVSTIKEIEIVPLSVVAVNGIWSFSC